MSTDLTDADKQATVFKLEKQELKRFQPIANNLASIWTGSETTRFPFEFSRGSIQTRTRRLEVDTMLDFIVWLKLTAQ